MSTPSRNTTFDAFDKSLNLPDASWQQGGAGMAVCHAGYIQYAVPDGSSDKQLTLLTSDLASYQHTHAISDLNHWTSQRIKDLFPGSMSGACSVQSEISTASIGAYNYFFWQDGAHVYRVLRTRPDMLEKPALAYLDLSIVGAPSKLKSNVAAFALPDTLPSLAGKLGIVLLCYSGSSTSYMLLAPLVLDPAAFVANSVWSTTDLALGYYPTIPLNFPSSNANSISAGWFNQGTFAADSSAEPQPSISLVVTIRTTLSSVTPACYSYATDLLTTFDQAYRMRVNNQHMGSAATTAVTGLESTSRDKGIVMTKRPDGQLAIQYLDTDNRIRLAVFQPAPAANSQPGLHSPVWDHIVWPTGHRDLGVSYNNTPCSVYLPLAPMVGPAPCAVDGKTYPECALQPYVQLVLTSPSNHRPTFSTFYWGAMFRIPSYRVGQSTTAYQGKMIVSMVADGFPYPVPKAEVWGPDSPSGMVNWLLCSYEYLVGNDTEVDIAYDVKNSIGMQSQTTLTVLGWGIHAEASLSAGFASLSTETNTTRRASSFAVTTKGLPADLSETAPLTPDSLVVSPNGALFGSTPPAQVAVDLCLVLPEGQTSPSSVLAAIARPVEDGSAGAVAGEFRSYCYTPGNLRYYEEAAINTQMQANFSVVHQAGQDADFVINGEDFSSYYTGGNYVQRIVERFGSPIFGPNGNQPYLEFAFSETGIQRSEYQSTAAFTTGSSMFVDGSFYAGLQMQSDLGVSGGLLGILDVSTTVFNFDSFLMGGTEFSTSMTTTNQESADWGVKLGEFLNPLAPGESYTVRMYLLKPSPLWARELQHFGGVDAGAIDTVNSAPVRILFTVLHISEALSGRLPAPTY